jgi:hypothetical protein
MSWLRISEIKERFPHLANRLDHWSRRGCPFLPGHRKPAREHRRVGNLRPWYWSEADLRAIDRTWAALAEAGDGDMLTLGEAVREFRITPHRLHGMNHKGLIHIRHEYRLVYRAGQTYLSLKAVVSRKELARWLTAKRPAPTEDSSLVTASEAEAMTKGDFSKCNLSYWEDHDCPYLGRRLEAVRRDRWQTLEVTFHGKKKKVRRPRRGLTHYRREEILEAYRNFRRNLRAAKGCEGSAASLAQGVYVDEHGRRWLTQAAAFRLHRARQQALEDWRERGWLEARRRKRVGYGRQGEVWYYSEADIVRLRRQQREGDGHVVLPEAAVGEKASSPEERGSLIAMPVAASISSGPEPLEDINAYSTRVAGYGPRALEEQYETTRNGVRDGMLDAMREVGSPVPPRGQAGRRSANHHFVAYFTEARARHPRSEKTDKDIILAYRAEHPEQDICKGKPTTKHYLDACRSALKEARKKV